MNRSIEIMDIDLKEALRYLGYGNNVPDDKTKELLIKCSE